MARINNAYSHISRTMKKADRDANGGTATSDRKNSDGIAQVCLMAWTANWPGRVIGSR